MFYFPVIETELPAEMTHWASVEGLIADRWENRPTSGLRSTVSRNWWHQQALMEIVEALQIEGLEFIQSEIICLRTNELLSARASLERALEEMAQGIPVARNTANAYGPLWWLTHEMSDGRKVVDIPICAAKALKEYLRADTQSHTAQYQRGSAAKAAAARGIKHPRYTRTTLHP